MIGALYGTEGIAHAVELIDYVRFVPSAGTAHVEWFHFVVRAGELDCVINLSLVGDGKGQLVLLVYEGGRWEGDVERFSQVSARSGRIGLQLGDNELSFDGAFRLRAACRHRPLSVELALEPRAFACLAHNMGGGLHWVVAPRLSASGILWTGGRAVKLRDAPAYHDHNWGQLDGRALGWTWACSLAPGPFAAVLVRIAGGAQALMLWQGPHRCRSFRGDALSLTSEGLLRPVQTLRVPRALSLLDPGLASDVPAVLRIEAASEDSRLSGELSCLDVARVLVPRPGDLGHHVINEVPARLRLVGHLGGSAVAIDGPAFAELARSAS